MAYKEALKKLDGMVKELYRAVVLIGYLKEADTDEEREYYIDAIQKECEEGHSAEEVISLHDYIEDSIREEAAKASEKIDELKGKGYI